MRWACRGLCARDGRVRSITAVGICKLVGRDPESVDSDTLKDALLRLTDIQGTVRKAVTHEVTLMLQRLLAKNPFGEFL